MMYQNHIKQMKGLLEVILIVSFYMKLIKGKHPNEFLTKGTEIEGRVKDYYCELQFLNEDVYYVKNGDE